MMRAAVLVVLASCGPQGDLPVSATPHVRADVRGQSSAPCVLTIANGPSALTYDVSIATADAVMATPASRDPLGTCEPGTPNVSVTVTPRDGAPPILVDRSSTCLVTYGARQAFFDAIAYDTVRCPKTAAVTLACGGETLYEVVPAALCTVGM